MIKYLLEVCVEELPYKFIPMAISQLEVGFKTFLESNNVGFDNIKVMATPRRLAVIVDGLAASQPDVEKTVKGPIATVAYDENKNLTPAGLGFAKKNGVEPSDLYVEENYLYAKISIKGKNTKELLQDNVPQIFAKLQGPHFMRWGSNDVKFSRPIRWVLSILDKEEVKIRIIDKNSSNLTNGHRFSTQNIVINNPDEYVAKLRDAHVLVNPTERKARIIEVTQKEADKLNAITKISDDLLEEVTFITEYPVAVTCNFDEAYLTIPQEVAVTVMETHQRYFALYTKEGKLTNKFVTITNYIGNEFENIKAGNLRVIKARLDDAVFFFNEDTKKPLESYRESLKGMTFQKGMGSVYDKTERIVKLAEKLNPSATVKRTAELCKADLATNLVFEFTELQGFIGADYARVSGEAKEVQEGIKEHYFPLNADSETAKSSEGQVVGIADKIDTICAVFAAGKKPTGSSDPLGVRRAALGIIKTILEHNLKIDLSKLIDDALELLPVKADCKADVEEFFTQRLIIFLANDYKKEVLEACTSKNPCVDLADYLARVKAVSTLNDAKLLENANRVLRILKDGVAANVDNTLFILDAEKNLYSEIKKINFAGDYSEYLQSLIAVNPVVTKFFDDVLVMDKDEKIKNNRLALLNELKNKYIMLTDFSKLNA